MASSNITIDIRVDFGMAEAQIRAISDFLIADDNVARLIAQRTFEALSAIQRMCDQARRDIGPPDETRRPTVMQVRLEATA